MQVTPYLSFNGRCEEAFEFYKRNLGAKVTMLMRLKDSPEKPPEGKIPPGMDEKIMHGSLQIGSSMLMGTDCGCGAPSKFEGFSLSLSSSNDAEAEKAFLGLAEGGKITMPMAETFFASKFGVVTDRFGVSWMVIVQKNM